MVGKIAAILVPGCVCKNKARGRRERNYSAWRSTFHVLALGLIKELCSHVESELTEMDSEL